MLPFLQSFADDGCHTVIPVNLHHPAGNGFVGIDDVNEEIVLAVPYRGGRDRQNAVTGAHQQLAR